MERKYSFPYGKDEVCTGSKILFFSSLYDMNGKPHYKGRCLCIFRYIEDERIYVEMDGKMYWRKKEDFLNLMIRVVEINGKKIPNPVTADEVEGGFILLLFAMGVTTIFNDRFGLWILEIIVYLNWAHHKKYDY